MKQIVLSAREFDLFKQIADFFFDFAVSKGQIVVSANAHQLEQLGY